MLDFFSPCPGSHFYIVIKLSNNGQWHHIAATRDNTSLKLYIDGVLIGTAPSTPVDFGSWVLHNYRLGYLGWKGSLDDVRFYKRVLSPTEINMLKIFEEKLCSTVIKLS